MLTARLPKARYDPDRQQTICSRKIREPLQIGRLPTSFSFGVFDGYVSQPCSAGHASSNVTQRSRTHVLADPTSFEEPSLDTSVSVVIDDAGGLISVMQLGLGAAGGQDVLSTCIDAAKECWQKTRKDVYKTS